jgi:hypothetical protein
MDVANKCARQNDRRIHTTLGELIATISEFALESAADTEEAYEIVRLVLGKILTDASHTRKAANRRFVSKYVH